LKSIFGFDLDFIGGLFSGGQSLLCFLFLQITNGFSEMRFIQIKESIFGLEQAPIFLFRNQNEMNWFE
jgi:hypothetical protein